MQATDLAVKLEAMLPETPEGAEALPLGGFIVDLVSKTKQLIAAVKAGEWKAALKLTRDLLTVLIGDEGEPALEFQQSAALGAGFRSTLIALLKEVLTEALLKVVAA